jgi:hypothetical protein
MIFAIYTKNLTGSVKRSHREKNVTLFLRVLFVRNSSLFIATCLLLICIVFLPVLSFFGPFSFKYSIKAIVFTLSFKGDWHYATRHAY